MDRRGNAHLSVPIGCLDRGVIKTLRMKEVGPDQPMPFDATLVNPKPRGDIKSTGTFGPINEENVRETAVTGNYSFTNVNLGTLNGISGILSSDGKYSGVLGRIKVEGETDRERKPARFCFSICVRALRPV